MDVLLEENVYPVLNYTCTGVCKSSKTCVMTRREERVNSLNILFDCNINLEVFVKL